MISGLPERMMRNLERRYRPDEFPALREQFSEWRDTRPLQGVRVLDATPMFFNTTAKYAALLAAGADLTAAYSDKMPYDPEIPAYLADLDIPCVHNAFSGPEEWDVILDCTAVHAARTARVGYVELTRSGIHRYAALNLPVFAADSGLVKEIETCLGTGESCLRALRKLGYGSFAGKSVLLFGHGKVGRGIEWHFRKAGARVTVVELRNAIRRPDNAFLAFDDASAVEHAIRSADFIVAVTGHPAALARYAETLLETHAFLLNMGAEDEYGPDIPPDCVLNRKQPLNFILDDPTRMCYIDPTMALHNAGALELLKFPPKPGLIPPPGTLEEHILRSVDRAGLISDELQWMKDNRL